MGEGSRGTRRRLNAVFAVFLIAGIGVQVQLAVIRRPQPRSVTAPVSVAIRSIEGTAGRIETTVALDLGPTSVSRDLYLKLAAEVDLVARTLTIEADVDGRSGAETASLEDLGRSDPEVQLTFDPDFVSSGLPALDAGSSDDAAALFDERGLFVGRSAVGGRTRGSIDLHGQFTDAGLSLSIAPLGPAGELLSESSTGSSDVTVGVDRTFVAVARNTGDRVVPASTLSVEIAGEARFASGSADVIHVDLPAIAPDRTAEARVDVTASSRFIRGASSSALLEARIKRGDTDLVTSEKISVRLLNGRSLLVLIVVLVLAAAGAFLVRLGLARAKTVSPLAMEIGTLLTASVIATAVLGLNGLLAVATLYGALVAMFRTRSDRVGQRKRAPTEPR